MTLAELRTALEAAKTDTDIQEVYFDFNTVLNETLKKSYPFILWDFTGMTFSKQLRTKQKEQTVTMNVFCAMKYVPDADKIIDWDVLLTDLDAYLEKVDTSEFVSVGRDDITGEVYPEGFVSVDREIAVRYEITLTLWC